MRGSAKGLLAVLLIAGLLTGCAADQSAQNSEKQPEPVAEVEKAIVDEGITIAGSRVEAAGKVVDLGEKNEYVQSVESCCWLEKTKIAATCPIKGTKSQDYYFVVYDVVRDMYLYEQYGKQFIWQNDDLDTLVYVLDYASEGEPSLVRNRKDMVLYESEPDEQIQNIAFVPKGIKVELADLNGDNRHQVLVEAAM